MCYATYTPDSVEVDVDILDINFDTWNNDRVLILEADNDGNNIAYFVPNENPSPVDYIAEPSTESEIFTQEDFLEIVFQEAVEEARLRNFGREDSPSHGSSLVSTEPFWYRN